MDKLPEPMWEYHSQFPHGRPVPFGQKGIVHMPIIQPTEMVKYQVTITFIVRIEKGDDNDNDIEEVINEAIQEGCGFDEEYELDNYEPYPKPHDEGTTYCTNLPEHEH